MENIDYYNQENKRYSQKRYPGEMIDYLHFFFRKRLELAKKFLKQIAKNNDNLLEIGCADGIVAFEINSEFKNVFHSIVGIDNAPKMIEVALSNKAISPNVKFFLRDDWKTDMSYDIILEIGVFNFTDMVKEIDFVRDTLKREGYYICSVASKKSLKNYLRREDKDFKNFLTFKQYEKEFLKYFSIIDMHPYGLFVPYLWKFPEVGRKLQPILERLFAIILPDIFHEKIFLLRLKD